MKKMIDLHMHIIPNVDDGSESLEMSEQMLRMAVEQGIDVIFATSHSLVYEQYAEYVKYEYQRLLRMVEHKKLPIKLCLGCEVLYDIHHMDNILTNLEKGRFPTLNGTKYVLTELFPGFANGALCHIGKLIEKGWIPIIAHAERYPDLALGTIKKMKESGCKIQINIPSIIEAKNEKIRIKALDLLENRLVDFVGTDAHGINRRPPEVAKGIEYLYEHFENEYIDDVLYNNAMNTIFKEK